MANINVNPTRMELMRLKTRLKTTIRGHKLLKDRADEMVRRFIGLINQNKQLRVEIEQETTRALAAFSISSAVMMRQEVEEALALPSYRAEVVAGSDSLMGIDVPKLQIKGSDITELYPYSFSSTTSEFDSAIAKTRGVIERLIKLAELEKTCDILADEIEKVRRRVNALEQFTIPQIRQEMKRIVMKLDENERSNLVRLMKVKELISDDSKEDRH